jgi:hypothetical protein
MLIGIDDNVSILTHSIAITIKKADFDLEGEGGAFPGIPAQYSFGLTLVHVLAPWAAASCVFDIELIPGD